MKTSSDYFAENVSGYSVGKVPVADVKKIIKAMAVVILDKAQENEPVKLKNFGTFGVYSWVLPEGNYTREDFKNGTVKRGKNTYKSGQVMKAGATHYRTVLKPSAKLKDALN